MAKTATSVLITDLLNRLGWNATGTTERVDALRQLNISSQEILQELPLRFMLASGTLSVVSSTCAVPATVDDGKPMILSRVGADGEIDYVEFDNWYRANIDTYGQGFAQTDPVVYTIYGATFLFKPAALTVSVPYIAHVLPTALTDGAGFSDLPKGYEDTLLLLDAEAELRRINNEPGVEELKARANDKREKLYANFRTTKLTPMVDRERRERKIEKSQLSDEAAP